MAKLVAAAVVIVALLLFVVVTAVLTRAMAFEPFAEQPSWSDMLNTYGKDVVYASVDGARYVKSFPSVDSRPPPPSPSPSPTPGACVVVQSSSSMPNLRFMISPSSSSSAPEVA